MTSDRDPVPSVEERTLYAVRALGILFIRSTVACFIGALIVGVGYGVLVAGFAGRAPAAILIGSVVIGVGVLVTIIWEIAVVVGANRELRKSGELTGGLGAWLGIGVK